MSPPTVSEHDALPTGSRLGEFEIECVLGVGGFGIVYRAFDHALERRVAVKEYMPAALATRGQEQRVALRSAQHAETFQLGLRSFINEARLLARFDHPALVKVYRFWEANDTAYMVMPWYEGTTLLEARRAMGHPPTQAWLRTLLDPLLGALDVLHKAQVYHRDIAPDNILLLGDATGEQGHALPVLLDFGAARRVIGDHTQTLTAIVKPSFAPIEQYAESAQLRQGPWTDLYALAAVVHYCITGRPPLPATARAVHDELPPLAGMARALERDFGRAYTAPFLAAVDHGLSVRPDERPPSVGLWRAALDGQTTATGETAGVLPPAVERTIFVGSVHGAPADPAAYATTVPAASPLRQLLSDDSDVIDVTQPDPQVAPAAAASTAAPTVPVDAPAPAAATTPWPATDEGASEPGSGRRLLAALGVVAVLGVGAAWGLNALLKRGEPAASVATGAPAQTSGAASAPAIAPVAAARVTAPDAVTQPAQSQHVSAATPPAAGGRSSASNAGAVSPPGRDSSRAGPASHASRAAREGTSVARRETERPRGEVEPPAREVEPTRRDSEPARRETAVAGPLNPRAACGDRVFIALALCMKRYCSRPEYTRHAECARMREQEEANRRLLP